MDRDVVNLIHNLRWDVTVDWGKAHDWLFCSQDTPLDAHHYLENGNQLPAPLRHFVLEVDRQLRDFPERDFMFGYPLDAAPRKPGEARPCFIVMPYGPNWFDDVHQTIRDAGKTQNFNCVLSLNMATAGQIVDQVWQQLRYAETIVADLTGRNSNVFYEVGLAHALGKQIIFITQDSDQLPFDVSTSRCIKYQETDLVSLQKELERAFAAVPQRYKFDPPPS
jgi:hypothetical protein